MPSADYDVIVIGGGGAGLACATTAAEHGCRVMVLEAEDKLGGSTGHSQGVFTAANTPLQRALGFTDTVEDFYHYYMTLNQWRLPAGLVRTFCENATPTMEWLISLGVEYPERMAKKPMGATWPHAAEEAGLYASGVEFPPRGHLPKGNGQAYIDALEQRASVLGAEVALNTRVRNLLIEQGGVCGVDVDGEVLRAPAVAITCGGFSHNIDLIREWFPDVIDATPAGARPTVFAAPGHRGDAIGLGLQAGAEIIGRNCGLANPRPYFQRTPDMPRIPGNQPRSLIYVNRQGHRFVDERAPYAVMPGLIKMQDFAVWGVFDEAARANSDPAEGGWAPDFVLERVRRKDFQCSETLELLAQQCGIRPNALTESVRQYNQALDTGHDVMFGRDMREGNLQRIEKGPFYAFELRANDLGITGAGVRIETGARALDPNGAAIPGLYAAGEAGAGVLGERYVGGGNSIANALTMGRIAGKSIAQDLGEKRLS